MVNAPLLARLVFLSAAMRMYVDAGTDVLKNIAWRDGKNCVDQAWGSDYAYIHECHGASNQQWELTADGLVRNADNQCFELPTDGDQLRIAPCDSARRQKWFLSEGQLKPQGFREHTGEWSMRIGACVDARQPDGRLIIHGCHGGPNQKFVSDGFPLVSEDVVLVEGPWPRGENCVDYDFRQGVAYVYMCHAQSNQRWSFTSKDELRVGGDHCLEYDAAGEVSVRPCSGLAKQKWVALGDGHVKPRGYQAADGSFVTMDSKCLDASLETRRLYLHDCIAGQANQKFASDVLRPKTLDLVTVEGPWPAGQNCVDYNYVTDVAYVYTCHGRTNQLWGLTADNQLRSALNNMCLTLGSDDQSVRMAACKADEERQQWRSTRDGQLQPMGYRSADSTSHVDYGWTALANKCLWATPGSGVLALGSCDASFPSQKFRSRVLNSVRDHVYTGVKCMKAEGEALVTAPCASERAQVWEFTLSSELRVDGKCLAFSGANASPKIVACDGSADQKWKPGVNSTTISPRLAADQCLTNANNSSVVLASCGRSTTQLFTSPMFSAIRGPTAPLFEKASSLLDAVLQEKALSARVLSVGAAVVAEADKVLSIPGSEATAARSYLLQFLFGTATPQDYSVPARILYETAQSKEFLLLTSVLVAAAQTRGATLEATLPFVKHFSDELYTARREVLWQRVLMENVAVLESAVDGSFDDFDLLGGSLVAICRATPLDLSMCSLAQFFELMDVFSTLRHRLRVEGASAISNRTLTLADRAAKLFSTSPLAAVDPLWARVMALLMFRAPYIDVLPDDVVAKASAPDMFLATFLVYSFFGTNSAAAAPIEAQVRLLSDQITSFHYAKLLSMAEMHEMDALDEYMTTSVSHLPLLGPINDYTSSDFPILVEFLAPRVCDEVTRVPLSLCQLETFHRGLQSVLRFERQRRADVVTLDDVLDVDVRKKLDVIDQEKKQYEMISTLQTVANKIGTTVKGEMATLKKQLAESTSRIRDEIARTRQSLREVLQTTGQQLLDTINESTRVLYDEIGSKATAIRDDIYANTRLLSQRLDERGQEILGAIEDSKQQLKYQIGAEAEHTRSVIDAKTEELKTHVSRESNGLREFIDARTNAVIGVVREEGQSTRVFIDRKTNQIISVVRDESEKTRDAVRTESRAIQGHLDAKAREIIGVVREDGRATRGVVTEKATELKKHITNEANGVKSRVALLQDNITSTMTNHYNNLYFMGAYTQLMVKNSTSVITEQMRVGAKKLGSIHKASCVRAASARSSFEFARGRYKNTTIDLSNDLPKAVEKLKNLGKKVKNLVKKAWMEEMMFFVAYGASTVGDLMLRVPKVGKMAKQSKPINANDALNLVGIGLDGVDDMRKSLAQLQKLDVAHDEMRQTIQRFEKISSNITKLAKEIPAVEATDPMTMVMYAKVVSGEASEAELEKFVSEDYTKMQVTFRHGEIGGWMREVSEVHAVTCNNVQVIKDTESIWTSKAGARAIDECHNLTNSLGGVSDRFHDAVTYMDQMRDYLAEMSSAEMECSVARKFVDNIDPSSNRVRLRERALQTEPVVSTNEPYFAMSFAALSHLILKYQLQEAGFQFCKFHEYRSGGVRPPMCGSDLDRTHFTLGQILEMRSWSPPTFTTIKIRGLLPTKPVYSVVHQRFYPYVDLQRLRDGDIVHFTLPTWDTEWLKKRGWVSQTVSPGQLPSVYLESVLLYLPLRIDRLLGHQDRSSLSATIRVETSETQPLMASNHQYRLQPQTFITDATYGATACHDANRVVNPYDVVARCTQADASSDVCVRVPGTSEVLGKRRLLPSLFSTWRISAEFSKSTGGALDLLVPRPNVDRSLTNITVPNETVGDLQLLADVVVVQIGDSSLLTNGNSYQHDAVEIAGDLSTCCAPDEFRASRVKCQKCSPGTAGAAHGFACVPIQAEA